MMAINSAEQFAVCGLKKSTGKVSDYLSERLIKEKPDTLEYAEITAVKKLLSNKTIKIYHGNKDKNMIPLYGCGGADNDYGRGFYTTPNRELAKEWAWGTYTRGNTAWLHTFELNTEGLNILNLTELDSIHWIAELVCHRKLNLIDKEVIQDNVDILLDKYKLNTDEYDIITGYRADDSYFAYAESFVSGAIYKDTLEKALRTGELGIQVFIKSEKAFKSLIKTSMEEVPVKYRNHFVGRDKRARDTYHALRLNQGSRTGKQTIYDFI